MASNITSTRWADHLRGCAGMANEIADILGLRDDAARQACFATVTIDAGKHNVFLAPIPEAVTSTAESVTPTPKPLPQCATPPKGEISPENQGAIKNATPEQAEVVSREVLIDGVHKAAKLLNAKGYTPPMSPESLNKFIEEKLQIEGGLGVLNPDQLGELLKTLTEKIATFKHNKTALEDEAGF